MGVIRVVAVFVVWIFLVVVAPIAVSTPDGLSAGGAPGLAAAEASVQPNFVVIVTDDQRFDTIGRCLPKLDAADFSAGADACMPEFQERLMSQGTTFLKGEVTQSLCCPSRASILTGQYSTNTGVTNLDGSGLDDSSTIATWLHDAGYRTGLIGKYLNKCGSGFLAGQIPPGWDSFHAYHAHNLSKDHPYTDYPWIDWDAGDVAPIVTRHNDDDSSSGKHAPMAISTPLT
jgi:arylsulfatase A-like enzyme